jgi:hypothetical protein
VDMNLIATKEIHIIICMYGESECCEQDMRPCIRWRAEGAIEFISHGYHLHVHVHVDVASE